MSLAIAAIMQHRAFIATDGRCTLADGTIIHNNFPKQFSLGSRAVIAAGGYTVTVRDTFSASSRVWTHSGGRIEPVIKALKRLHAGSPDSFPPDSTPGAFIIALRQGGIFGGMASCGEPWQEWLVPRDGPLVMLIMGASQDLSDYCWSAVRQIYEKRQSWRQGLDAVFAEASKLNPLIGPLRSLTHLEAHRPDAAPE